MKTKDITASGERPTPLAVIVARRAELIAFLRPRVRPTEEPEDVLQQALLTATQKIGQLRDPQAVMAWFYRILRRALADHHARWAARAEKLPLVSTEAEIATEEAPDTCACSLALVERLPPQYATVLQRIDVGDESIDDVAASLGTTTNNVTVRLHRARKALRNRLATSCGTTSSASCLDCACNA